MAYFNAINLKKNNNYAKLMCMNAQKNDWNDVHVAYQVIMCGTLSAAAEALDVHHSTVLRRVNALEKRLGARLFHRHARGYTPTEAGLMLKHVAENTQTNFDRLFGQLQGVDTQLKGTLVITSVNALAPNITPILADFQRLYPEIRLEFAAESRIYKLEHGEAHVGIRPGAKPTDPDYVVQPLAKNYATLYGSREYIRQYGKMSTLEDINGHRFVSTINPLRFIKFMEWLEDSVPSDQIYFRSSDFVGFVPAIKAGLGIAPLNCWLASTEPELLPVIAPPEQWAGNLWLVTHRDMHRTSKVQAFTQFLKKRMLAEQETMTVLA
jgi:DNA-binding transcriptional LysR family regulator